MRKFEYILYLIWTFLTISLLVGCGPRMLETGAENISIQTKAASLSKECKFIGIISGTDVHENMDLRSSPQELKLDDVNFLKNEGKKLGANVIVLKQHQISTKEIKGPGKGRSYITVTPHNIEGDAYFCHRDE